MRARFGGRAARGGGGARRAPTVEELRRAERNRNRSVLVQMVPVLLFFAFVLFGSLGGSEDPWSFDKTSSHIHK